MAASAGSEALRGGGVSARPPRLTGEVIVLVDRNAEAAVDEGVPTIGFSYIMVTGLSFAPFAGKDCNGGSDRAGRTLELGSFAEEGKGVLTGMSHRC